MEKNCPCLNCQLRNINQCTIEKMNTDPDNVIRHYLQGLHTILLLKDEQMHTFNETKKCDSPGHQSVILTKHLFSFFPNNSILEHSNCLKIKHELKKLSSEYLTFRILVLVYFSQHYSPKLSCENDLHDLVLKYHEKINEEEIYGNWCKKAICRSLKRYQEMIEEMDELERENKELRLMVEHYQNMPGGEEYEKTKEHFVNILKQ